MVHCCRPLCERPLFQKVLQDSRKAPITNVNIRQINFPEDCRLLREWLNCGVSVFFDFSELSNNTLWFLLPINISNEAYLIGFSREEFIKVHNENGFDELIYELIPNIRKYITDYKRKSSSRSMGSLFNQQRRRFTRRRRF